MNGPPLESGGVTDRSVPSFTRGHRLQYDRVRDLWIIQAPEKALIAEDTAPHILRLVDGETPVGAIVTRLASIFSAPRSVIDGDVRTLIADLAARGVLRL